MCVSTTIRILCPFLANRTRLSTTSLKPKKRLKMNIQTAVANAAAGKGTFPAASSYAPATVPPESPGASRNGVPNAPSLTVAGTVSIGRHWFLVGFLLLLIVAFLGGWAGWTGWLLSQNAMLKDQLAGSQSAISHQFPRSVSSQTP
jgi:hypothetical protein